MSYKQSFVYKTPYARRNVVWNAIKNTVFMSLGAYHWSACHWPRSYQMLKWHLFNWNSGQNKAAEVFGVKCHNQQGYCFWYLCQINILHYTLSVINWTFLLQFVTTRGTRRFLSTRYFIKMYKRLVITTNHGNKNLNQK